jgi:PKD repeat protein
MMPSFMAPPGEDSDDDGVLDDDDNCPYVWNPLQEDYDNDDIGDVCDDCTDTDGDGYGNPGFPVNTCPDDNCPDDYNPGQEDYDGDGIGDVCDPNAPPDTPSTPTGPTTGNRNIEYDYSTSTTDFDGNNIYYFWYWGDGTGNTWYGPYSSGETCTQSHQWTDLGTYNVKVKAKDQDNEESQWSDPISMTIENILPWVRMNGPYEAEVGEDILFDGSDSIDPDGTITLYEWSYSIGWGLPVEMGTGVALYYSFDEAGDYVIYLTLTDNDGGTNYTTTTATITETGLDVDAGGPYTGETGIPIQFSSSVHEGTPPYSFSWDFGDGGTSTEQNPLYIYDEPGQYYVILSVTDSQGLSGSHSTEATIDTGPLSVDANGPYHGTISEPVSFVCTVTGGKLPYSYLWDFGDGESSIEENPNHQYTTENTYDVTLTITDNQMDSLSNTTTAIITSEPNNPPDKPTLDGPSEGEPGIEYTFTATSSDPDGDIIRFTWNFGEDRDTILLREYHSDEVCIINHTWDYEGDFEVKVKVRDIYGAESEWSDPIEISVPKKPIINPFQRFISLLLKWFPFLESFI